MPSKKKKYNARFPPARIKKIMQKDEEVGKVASTVPVMISRLLELFTESLILKTNELTLSVNARTLTTGHLKQIILSERKFDFLKDLVTHIPDVQANEEDGGDSNSDQGVRVRPRGRPRKIKDQVSVPKKRGRKPKAAAAVAASSVDDVGDDGITDDSETEDADSCSDEEDGESMSEDTAAEAGASNHQSCKRQCIEGSFSSTCGSTSSAPCADAVGQGASDTSATANSTSPLLANKQRGETFRSDLTASCSSNVPTIFRNTGAGKTVNETCLPLNLTATGSPATAMNTVTSAFDFTKEKTEPHPRQLPTRINFERTAFDTNTNCLLASPGLGMPQPPLPAHQPVTQASGTPIVPSSVLSFNVGMKLFPRTASEFLPQSNSTGVLLAYGTTPVSSGSLVKDTSISSQVLPDGTPPVTISTTSSSCGHAVHRMPIVPASFLPGAILARSMSVPHSCSTSKPSSLVISPEDDYDS